MIASRGDEVWQTRAACRGPHATVFFPPPHAERKDERVAHERAAKAICRPCPVRQNCLEYAIRIREAHGIWGGLSEAERKQLIDQEVTTGHPRGRFGLTVVTRHVEVPPLAPRAARRAYGDAVIPARYGEKVSSAPEPRDAATLAVVRDVASSSGPKMEVLMVRRRASAVFAGGAQVFPGGAVDASDRDPATVQVVEGGSDREASRLLNLQSGGLGYFVAAVRECFEEAGLLFAEGPGGPVSFGDPASRERFRRHRRNLNSGATTLAAICQEEGLLLSVGRLRYISHWITPVGSPRRFDTRFFVGVVPEGQTALHDDAEVVASEWVVPSVAIERHHAGEIDLMLPTLKHLETFSRFSSAAALWGAPAEEVATIEPRINVDGDDVSILLPGEPGFDRATGLVEGMEFPDGTGVHRG